ncbi:hypothetical protein CR513_23758, partial [Mucuna pruriens]
MEQAMEELEQLNAEIRAEMRMEMGQMKEQINKMFEIITRNAAPTPAAVTPGAAPSTATSGTPTHPPGFTPPAWNATTENPPAPQEQPAGNTSGLGRGQGSGTGPLPTPGATIYYHPPPEAGRVLGALEERMRAIEGTGGHGIDAFNLCLVPNIELPADFKVPKFEKYKGSSCPRVHLAMYCRKMAPYTQQDKILMHCFQDSLSGAALRWYVGLDNGHIKTWRDLADAFLRQYKYNEDMAPDRSRLQNLSKADAEGFKDYAQRWRELAAQVQPPLSEREMASMFIDTLPSPFYDKVVGSVASNFTDLVIIGERIEAGIKRGRFAQDQGNTSFGNKPNISTNPLPNHEGQAINTLSHSAFASDQEEEVVATIGRQGTLPFQPLIIQCNPFRPTPLIITAPPKPAYKNNHAVPWHYDPVPEEPAREQTQDLPTEEVTNIAEPGGMTCSGRIYTPVNLGKDPKGVPKEKELIRYSEYELLDHLNKTSARISLLSLLLNSKSHHNLLLKILKEAHVAPDITTEKFGGIVSNLTSTRRLTFLDEEIPTEGRQHNQPLHIAVKCGTYMITRVLIDNGSSLNVLPKATLDKLGSTHVQLKASPVIVRAFDGSRRDVMGEITLPIYMVMDICPAYSFLLGRPWIHGAGAVPSSLHQKVKFIADRQLVSVMGERELVISTPAPDEYIEEEEEALETSFQALELTTGSEEPPSATGNMAFRVMIKEGYQPGKGLGPLLEGIPAPIEIQENKGRAGLGYQASNHEKARPTRATWGQHFVRESVTVISSQPRDQYGRVCVSDEHNMTHVREDSSPIEEPIGDEDAETEALAEVERQIEQERPKFQPLTKELESGDLGDERNKKEVRIGNQMSQESRKALVELLQEFSDIFAWSYRDMPGLDRSIVEHRLPMLLESVPVRQQLRRMKPDVALKIKEEVEKQWDVGFLAVSNYPQWVANIVPVPKKDGKVRMCVDYRDLNWASPKDNFPLTHIDMLVDNTVCHAFFSFMDGFS